MAAARPMRTRRVRAAADENARLRGRVRELERELADAGLPHDTVLEAPGVRNVGVEDRRIVGRVGGRREDEAPGVREAERREREPLEDIWLSSSACSPITARRSSICSPPPVMEG